MADENNNPSWLDRAQDSKPDVPDEAAVGDEEPLMGNDNDEENPFVLKERQAGNDDEDEDEENPFVLKESQPLLSSKDGYGAVEVPKDEEEEVLETTRRPPRRNVAPFLFLLFTTRVVLGDPVQSASTPLSQTNKKGRRIAAQLDLEGILV
eukprot:scaffold34664_cov56-Attheya_sp.AAC.2